MVAKRIAQAPPALDDRTEARSFKIDQLMRFVREGRIRVPRFQRPFVWQDNDRIALFDSVYRGYPIGTLLFWQREAAAQRLKFGSAVFDGPPRPEAYWVVDGQQRITTLAEALLDPRAAHPIEFDLDSTTFFVETRAAKPRDGLLVALRGRESLPMSVVLDHNGLLEWLFRRPHLNAVQRQHAIEVATRLRDYDVPAYVVETKDETVLRTIFDRTNRSGKSLNEKDVFNALFGTLSEEQPADLAGLVSDLESLGFGQIDQEVALNALRAVGGLALDRPVAETMVREDSPRLLRTTAEALRATVLFLRHRVGIPHAALVPYAQILVVLAKFFSVFPSPSHRIETLLRRFVWRASLNARLPGDIIGSRQALKAVVAGAENDSIARLLELAGRSPPEEATMGSFKFNFARTKLQVCALAAAGPRHLLTNEPIDIEILFGSKQALPAIDADAESTLANRLLHPMLAPRELVRAIASCRDEKVLRSHVITERAREDLREAGTKAFLERRRADLEVEVGHFFARQAEWGADDSPALDTLIVRED